MRTIGVVTGTRADFGLYLPVLNEIEKSPGLNSSILACGTHLEAEYGETVAEIEQAGFPVARKIQTFCGAHTPGDISRSMARTATGFSEVFEKDPPDIVLLLGDRYEMFAAAATALVHNLPLAHIHGGELSEGANDDAFRHSITKMSHLHFVSTKEHARRVMQLGEEADRIHVTGAPGLDMISSGDNEAAGRDELEKFLGISLETDPVIATFHPVTLEPGQAMSQVRNMISALEKSGRPVVMTYPNADAEAAHIVPEIESFAASHRRVVAVPSLGIRRYHGLLRISCAMVGNSSSGIIEAASFELPVVNIGTRQRGRTRGANVIDVSTDPRSISEGLRLAMNDEFRATLRGMKNPYGDGQAAPRIVRVLQSVDLGPEFLKKKFNDWTDHSGPSQGTAQQRQVHG